MAEYVVISFPGKSKALEVLGKLEESGEFDHNIEAAAVVSCDEKMCSIVRRSTSKMTVDAFGGTMAGGVTGMLLGTGIADPKVSPFLGSAGGGLGEKIKGELSELGIEEAFSHEVNAELKANTSAICFLFWEEPWNDFPPLGKKIIKEAHGTVLKTTLSVTDEEELRAKLEEVEQRQNKKTKDK